MTRSVESERQKNTGGWGAHLLLGAQLLQHPARLPLLRYDIQEPVAWDKDDHPRRHDVREVQQDLAELCDLLVAWCTSAPMSRTLRGMGRGRGTHQRIIAALLELERELPTARALLQHKRLEVRRRDDVPARERREALRREAREELVHDVRHLHLCRTSIQLSRKAWGRGREGGEGVRGTSCLQRG